MGMTQGYWVSQICGTTARVALGDELHDGPRTVSELASLTSADPDGPGRLLRAGAAVGLFTELEDEHFGLTPLGVQLTNGCVPPHRRHRRQPGRAARRFAPAAPSATGVLFDLPEVVDGAREVLAASRQPDRVELVGGDFIEQVPAGGDLYLLKSILHDWHDERALQILRSIHRASAPGARLAVIEVPLPSQPAPSPRAPGKPTDAARARRPGTHPRGLRTPARPGGIPARTDDPRALAAVSVTVIEAIHR